MNVLPAAMEDCPICETIRDRGLPQDAIAELATCWVTSGYPKPPIPGYACVVAKRHVEEPYELDDEDGAAYWLDIMRAARALAAVTAPRKLNYEIHGNTVPHLHAHLLPREPSRQTSPERFAEELRRALG